MFKQANEKNHQQRSKCCHRFFWWLFVLFTWVLSVPWIGRAKKWSEVDRKTGRFFVGRIFGGPQKICRKKNVCWIESQLLNWCKLHKDKKLSLSSPPSQCFGARKYHKTSVRFFVCESFRGRPCWLIRLVGHRVFDRLLYLGWAEFPKFYSASNWNKILQGNARIGGKNLWRFEKSQ